MHFVPQTQGSENPRAMKGKKVAREDFILEIWPATTKYLPTNALTASLSL